MARECKALAEEQSWSGWKEQAREINQGDRKQEVQCEPAGEEGGIEEDWKMDVDEEPTARRSWIKKKEPAKTVARSREAHPAFPMIDLPKDDHTDCVQEERIDLPYWRP